MGVTVKGNDLSLGRDAAQFDPALAVDPFGIGTTDKGLIGLHDLASAAQRLGIGVAHGFANPVRHEPSGFEGNAKGAVKLIRGNALFAADHQEDRLQPDMHFDVAGFEDGSYLDGERLAAVVALVNAYTSALALQLIAVIHAAAFGANPPIRPDTGLYPVVSGLFVVELRSAEY